MSLLTFTRFLLCQAGIGCRVSAVATACRFAAIVTTVFADHSLRRPLASMIGVAVVGAGTGSPVPFGISARTGPGYPLCLQVTRAGSHPGRRWEFMTATTEKSTAELVRELTEQLKHLARTEATLAVRELKGKAKHAGLGIGIAGAGGLFAFYGGAVLVAAAVLLLALVLPAWGAALIVAGALFAVAGVAILLARKQLRQSAPVPSPALESAKEDIQAVKHDIQAAKEAHR